MELSDEQLLEGYIRGDSEALGALVGRYRRMLYGFIFRMAGNAHDADEAFQEVWLKVIRKAQDYRRGSFRGWIFRIARNVVIDRLRSAKGTISLEQEVGGGEGLALADCMADSGASPGTLAGRKDVAAAIGKAVEALAAEQREVFLMRVQADLPFKEIARIQKVSVNTALARMHYAVGNLRKRLANLDLQGELT